MSYESDPEEVLKQLERRKEELAKDIEELEEQHQRGTISDDYYQARLRELQREVVEVMDRIVQMEFLAGRRRALSGKTLHGRKSRLILKQGPTARLARQDTSSPS